jgi:hypothetical protein
MADITIAKEDVKPVSSIWNKYDNDPEIKEALITLVALATSPETMNPDEAIRYLAYWQRQARAVMGLKRDSD